jgi:hypothetical protein
MKVANWSFENVAKVIYLGKTTMYEIACMKKVRSDYIQGMPVTILSRIFCLPICY